MISHFSSQPSFYTQLNVNSSNCSQSLGLTDRNVSILLSEKTGVRRVEWWIEPSCRKRIMRLLCSRVFRDRCEWFDVCCTSRIIQVCVFWYESTAGSCQHLLSLFRCAVLQLSTRRMQSPCIRRNAQSTNSPHRLKLHLDQQSTSRRQRAMCSAWRQYSRCCGKRWKDELISCCRDDVPEDATAAERTAGW